MGRGKLNMTFITKEKVRLSTYQKRKKGLLKKAHEFSVLCGVETCLIIYGPKPKDGPAKLEIFPSDPTKVMNVIKKYRAKPLDARQRKSFNVFDYLATRQKELDDEICKVRRANIEAKFPTWDDRLNNFSINQLWALLARFDSKIEAATKRINMLKESQHHQCLIGESKSGILAGPSIHQTRLDLPDQVQARPCLFPMNNFDLEVPSRQQPMKLPFDMNVPSYYPLPFDPAEALQLQQPFNPIPNPIDTLMKRLPQTNRPDYTQFDGESSSNITNHSLSPQVAYDPPASMLDKVMLNNPWGPFCFYRPFMQPMAPFGHPAEPTFPSHQFGDFFRDIDEPYESNNKEYKF